MQMKIPSQKAPPIFRVDPFQGIDLSATPSQIGDHNSPDMLNFMLDERGTLNKRTGYERVYATSLGTGKINGLFWYDYQILIAHGTKLYSQTGSNQPVQLYDGLADADTSFFIFKNDNNKDVCYIMDGTNYLVYDNVTVSQITPYIPTLTIARTPSGGGSANEDWNLMGRGFKDSFSADGTANNYHLSQTNLDSDTVTAVVNGSNMSEGSGFTVDRSSGIVTFSTAPAAGTDNVIITAYKTYSDKPTKIKQCRYNVLFGGSNDTRVFVSGNPDTPARMWRSGLFDATYFPENGEYTVGDHEWIQGFTKQYDYVIIEKKFSKWSMEYSLDSNGNVSFPLKPVNDTIGTIAPKSIQSIDNTPISLDETGVFILKASTVRDQTNVEQVSQPINARLLNEASLENAVSVDFNNKYYLALNGNVYVFDYLIGEWYIYDNINPSWFLVIETDLYFGSNTDGLLYKFKKATDENPYNDDGTSINAYWYSKLLDFQAPEMLKMVNHIYMSMKTDLHTSNNVYILTDKKGETFTDTKRIDKIDFTQLDFNRFGFVTSNIPQELSKKMREKKITHFQIKIENNNVDESLGITSLGILFDLTRMVR